MTYELDILESITFVFTSLTLVKLDLYFIILLNNFLMNVSPALELTEFQNLELAKMRHNYWCTIYQIVYRNIELFSIAPCNALLLLALIYLVFQLS